MSMEEFMNKLTWKYIKPILDVNTIEIFQKQNSIELPKEIINCFIENNGGRPNIKYFDTLISKGHIIKSLLSFNDDDFDTIYDAYNAIKQEHPHLIPVFSDPFGNYICYDHLNNDIVYWLHENSNIEKITNNFTDFLNILY